MKEFDFIFWFGSIPISEIFSVIWIAILTPPIIGILVMGWQEGIKIKHKDSGIERKCFIGFSWTYFLFGFFVPVFRGEITLGIVHAIFVFITFRIFQLIMPFLYNKQHAVRLLTSSWELNDTQEKNNLASKVIGIAIDL